MHLGHRTTTLASTNTSANRIAVVAFSCARAQVRARGTRARYEGIYICVRVGLVDLKLTNGVLSVPSLSRAGRKCSQRDEPHTHQRDCNGADGIVRFVARLARVAVVKACSKLTLCQLLRLRCHRINKQNVFSEDSRDMGYVVREPIINATFGDIRFRR